MNRGHAMPKLVELTEDEFKSTSQKARGAPKRLTKREKVRRRYQRLLKPFIDGGFVEVTIQKGETRQTVKNRLKRAAEELDLTLDFKRTRNKIRFEVKK